MAKKLTKPQASYLSHAMQRPTTCYGSDHRVVGRLLALGYLERVGRSDLCHAPLYAPTRSGLEALLYDRKLADCKSGSIASMQRVQEVEARLLGAPA